VFWVFLGAYFVARLFFAFGPWNQQEMDFSKRLTLGLIPWINSGLVMYGGLVGAVIAGWVYCKMRRLDFWKYADSVALGGSLAMVFGRFGCFFAFDHPTTATNLPWALVNNGQSFHPSVLYESIFFFVLFIFLLKLKERQGFSGQIFLTTMISYAVARFLIEFTRVYDYSVYGFTGSQIVSLVLFTIFVPVYLFMSKKSSSLRERFTIGESAIRLLSIAGLLLVVAVYFVSQWPKTVSFVVFVFGMGVLIKAIMMSYRVSWKELKKDNKQLFHNLLVIFITIIVLFSLSSIIQRVVGSQLDTDELKECPHAVLGNTSSEVKIIYVNSPYCTICWKEELIVFPQLFEEMGDSFFMEKYDVRHCKEIASGYGIYATPGFVISNENAEREFTYYGYRSFEGLKKDILFMKNLTKTI
jgi:prolipoprotein diacylglyceryltransferase